MQTLRRSFVVPGVQNGATPSAAPMQLTESGAVVTERTAKKWKAIQLAGSGLIALAVLVGAIAFANASLDPRAGSAPGAVAGVLFIVGILVRSYARSMAWWHHG